MKHLIHAELRKAYDTRTARIMIALTFVFACLGVAIMVYMGKHNTEANPAAVTQSPEFLTGGIGAILGIIAGFSILFLGIAFIYLICQEWNYNLSAITYVTTPRRLKVIVAKLCAVLILFVALVALLTLLSLLAAVFLSNVCAVNYSTLIRFNTLYGKAVLGIFLNIALAVAMAYCIKNQSWAILFYLFLPFMTTLVARAPFIEKINSWFVLGEHVLSPINMRLLPHQEWYHTLVSVAIWIVVPLGIGIVRSMKEDL